MLNNFLRYKIGWWILHLTAAGFILYLAYIIDPSASARDQKNTVPLVIITNSPLSEGTVGTFNSRIVAAAGGIVPYSWSLEAGSILPDGMTLSDTGLISGTSMTPGTFNFTVQVTDALSAVATKDLSITIGVAPLSVVTASPIPNGTLGTYYSLGAVASGGITPYIWSLFAGSLPGGMIISTNGTICGTPVVPGTYNFTLQVMDTLSTIAKKDLSITIITAPLIVTTVSPMPNGIAGSSYSRGVAASGGINPYTWSLSAGNLPAGLVMSSNGTISGVPNAPGTFNFTVQVMDTLNTIATKDLSITIGVAPLSVETASPLPNGTAGTYYSKGLGVSGGVKPYTWSLKSGSQPLPAGFIISINGTVCGTTVTPGTYNFTVQVTDSRGTIVSRIYSLTIN